MAFVIVPWKNTGDEPPTLFYARWDEDESEYIADPSGDTLCYYDFVEDIHEKITVGETEDTSAREMLQAQIVMGRPTLGIKEDILSEEEKDKIARMSLEEFSYYIRAIIDEFNVVTEELSQASKNLFRLQKAMPDDLEEE